MTKPKLVIATHNQGKSDEIRKILGDIAWELLTLVDFEGVGVAIENKDTYEGNAIAKAVYYASKTRHWVMADDSGLEVSALGGGPGVYSARYGGESATDQDRRQRLLTELATSDSEDRSARFVCTVAIANPNAKVLGVFEGICEGAITTQERGTSGFGYDPIFVPNGYRQTFGELSEEVKNTVSHRAKALLKAREFLTSPEMARLTDSIDDS